MTTQHTTSFAVQSSSTVQGSSPNEDNKKTDNVLDGEKGNALLLPPSNDDNKDIKTLKLGESMKLDHLGPIILNTDGTTRRIDNWDILTEREREVTWRRIKKRNEERRKVLEQKQQE